MKNKNYRWVALAFASFGIVFACVFQSKDREVEMVIQIAMTFFMLGHWFTLASNSRLEDAKDSLISTQRDVVASLLKQI